jgi:molybdopterin converting factor small subunit
MKIHVKSNFVVPGLDKGECVDLDQSQLTLREFLEELSERSPTRVEYVRSGAQTINPDEWEIRINDTPYQQWSAGLETSLKDGDTVTIIIIPLGGG